MRTNALTIQPLPWIRLRNAVGRDHTPTGCLLHRSYVIELEDGRQIAARPRNVRDAASAVEEAGDRLDELEKELDEMEAALDAEEQEQEQ